MRIRTYSELSRLKTFEERFEYLKLNGVLGESTFGFDRYLNQAFYRSKSWKIIRRNVIVRDESCDLGIKDRVLYDRVTIHHLNPITLEDIELGDPNAFDLDNLICTSHDTHNAIHYGDISLIQRLPIERKKGDTIPWMRTS